MTINKEEARKTIESLNAVGSPVERGVRPVAYRLKDQEATEHYGREVYVYWSGNEFRQEAKGAKSLTELLNPMYDQAALDAVVAAERERLIEILRNKMQDLDNKGQCVAAQAFDLAIVLLKKGKAA